MPSFISIDQNCQPLWDVVPKLQALAAASRGGVHCIEDVDVAFTLRGGAALPPDSPPGIARERVYRGGVSDWGAALFYTEFLGRNPLDVKDLESFTGWTTSTLAKRLERTVDELYDAYSLSDNHQLVGPSFVKDSKYHRTIADLRVDEVKPPLNELLELARQNMLEAFPAHDAQERVRRWFEDETTALLEDLDPCAGDRLPALYEAWLRRHRIGADVRRTSDLFALSSDTDAPGGVLNRFLADYSTVAPLYNRAVEETNSGQNPLRMSAGELPFAVVFERNGRWLRGDLSLDGDWLVAAEDSWRLERGARLPVADMQGAGVRAIVGKALILVLQVRWGEGGAALALPKNGSQYMPTARRFETLLLDSIGASAPPVQPIWRVCLNVPDRLRSSQTPVRLPTYLHRAFGCAECAASTVAERFYQVRDRARRQLEQATEEEGRQRLWREWAPDQFAERDALEERRRELGRNPETRDQAPALWEQIKQLDADILEERVERLVETVHCSRLDFWNSRGAILPWAVAAGGEELYRGILDQAEIHPE